MIRSIFKDFGIYGLIPFLPKLGSLAVLPLITPHLTAIDYGVFGVIMAYVGLLKILSTLGLSINLSNSFYKSTYQHKWLWRQIYGFLTLWNIFFAVVLGLVVLCIIPTEALANSRVIVVLVVLPTLLFGATIPIAEAKYQLSKNPQQIVIKNTVASLITLSVTYVLIKHFKLGYMGWFWANFISTSFLGFAWGYSLIFRSKMYPIFNFKIRTIKQALKIGLPVLPHTNALMLLNQADRIVMERMSLSASAIGLYNVTYTVANIFDMVGFAYSRAVTPYVLEMLKEKKEELLRKIILYSQVFFFAAALAASLLAQEILPFIIRNDELNTEYGLFTLLVMSMIFKPMYVESTTRVLYSERTNMFGIHSLGAGVLNILLNLLLIPLFGIEAAAFTTFIGFGFLAYSRFFSKEYKENSTISYFPILFIVLSLLVCLLGYYLAYQGFMLRMVILMILIIALVIIGKKMKHTLELNDE